MRWLVFLAMSLASLKGITQTCTGGLGDPIVDINFGSGTNYGPALAPGITNLQYVSNECPEDGYYTIASSVNGCFGGTWLNLTTDHTGNPHGYFMLINASYQPSQFFVQTVNGLCSGTTYQFAAWVLNLASQTGQILPNITFTITNTNGDILDTVESGNVPVTNPARWNQYTMYFTTPPNTTSVILRMNNNAPGGVGNDLAIDDITFRPAGPAMSVSINGQSADSIRICTGSPNPVNFFATVESCYTSTTFQWQESMDNGSTWTDIPGATTQTFSTLPVSPGTDLYRITTAQSGNIGLSSCKVASSAATIQVLKIPGPAINITDSSDAICANTPTTFTASPVDGGDNPLYQWTLNGSAVPSNGPVYTGPSFADGDKIVCILTSDAACVINPVASSNTITLAVTPNPVSSVTIDASATTICSDSIVQFTATPFNGGNQPRYRWQVNGNPVGTDAPLYSSAGLQPDDAVKVVMTGSLRCSLPDTSNIVAMTVYPTPSITLTADTIIAPRKSIRLAPLITGQIISYAWIPSAGLDNPASATPLATPDTTTVYQLQVTSGDGCTAVAKERVALFYDLFMPTGFTPNGDGRNDIFRVPPSVPVTVKRFSVFNRWGGLLFMTTDSGTGWDGRFDGHLQQAGTYVWIVEYIDPLTKRPMRREGTIELIR